MKKFPQPGPTITSHDIKEVVKVLKSGKLAQGEKVENFEREFGSYLGSKYAIATSNGTTALHLALLGLGLQKGDEVITTPFSFIASTNAIVYVGAKPVFVDIGEDYNLDADKIEEKITKNTKAILVVHLYGTPANMPRIIALAKKHSLRVIEDCAQAHGATINNRKVGTFGDVGCFSFYPTKNMTTIEGGMVTTNSLALTNKIKLLRNHGSVVRYHHQQMGFNFRLSDVQAALGLSQLTTLEKNNQRRIQNAILYRQYLKNIKEIKLPINTENSKAVYHQFTLSIKKRNYLKKELEKFGIFTEIYYPIPIHKQPFIKKLGFFDRLPMTEKAAKEVLSLPIHPKMTRQQIRYIAIKIKEILASK